MKQQNNLWKDEKGGAVVEATILFPIIIMIFAALVLLAMYLPTRGALQYATQFAATAIATEKSDTWQSYDEDSDRYVQKSKLDNVYISVIKSIASSNENEKAEGIVKNKENTDIISFEDKVKVDCKIINYVIYKEVAVTATRNIPMPVNLSFIKFPTEIPITVTSTAVVQNGDEFIRNVDLATDFIGYLYEKLDEKYQFSQVFEKVNAIANNINAFLGI